MLMRGATDVRRGIIDFLKVTVPEQRAIALAQWDLDGEHLPAVEHYIDYEPKGMPHGSGPVIGVNVTRASNFRTTDFNSNGDPEYRATYQCRVFLWCFTPDDENEGDQPDEVPQDARFRALRSRDDLAGVVRSALLTRLNLHQDGRFTLNEQTLVEEYSDGEKVNNTSGRYIAAVAIAFDLQMDEYLFTAPMNVPGLPNDVTVTTRVLPHQEEYTP